MLLQYCAPLHLQSLNVRFVCAGVLHLEHKTVELSVKLEDVFFLLHLMMVDGTSVQEVVLVKNNIHRILHRVLAVTNQVRQIF